VRSHRTISPLLGAGVYATARFPASRPTRYCASRVASRRKARGVAEAVSFLWHWPSMVFKATSGRYPAHCPAEFDFLPRNRACARPPAATARSSCQSLVYANPPQAPGRHRIESFESTANQRHPLMRNEFPAGPSATTFPVNRSVCVTGFNSLKKRKTHEDHKHHRRCSRRYLLFSAPTSS